MIITSKKGYILREFPAKTPVHARKLVPMLVAKNRAIINMLAFYSVKDSNSS